MLLFSIIFDVFVGFVAADSVANTTVLHNTNFLLGGRTMGTIAEGVEFDTIAREWRCKWSADHDKKSLVEAQKALQDVVGEIAKVDGFTESKRIVCGECQDFKIITPLPASKYEAWSEKQFAPEKDFLDKLRSIDGISQVETQTYTFMPVKP